MEAGAEALEAPSGGGLVAAGGGRSRYPEADRPSPFWLAAGAEFLLWPVAATKPVDEKAQLRKWLSNLRKMRDTCLLRMLGQHGGLTTDQVHDLFFPGLSRRGAQTRMQVLMARGLLTACDVVERRGRQWIKRPNMYLLTPFGATVLARANSEDVGKAVARAEAAQDRHPASTHDQEVVGWFVWVAREGAHRAGEGLYHWVSASTMRSTFQAQGLGVAPDGWGRYLTAHREVTFHLEWDMNTEPVSQIVAKAVGYARAYADRGPEDDVVLFMAPNERRERAIRESLRRGAGGQAGRFYTGRRDLLIQHGPLGAMWWALAQSEERREALPELPGVARTDRQVSSCLGQTGWWYDRPAAGEGS